MFDLFASPKRRITRANTHISNLETGFNAFVNDKPYAVVTEEDAEENTVVKIKLTKPLPDEWTDLTFDAAEALRSALDQAAFATAMAAGRLNPKSAYFPVANDAAGLETGIRGRCKDVPPEIVALFRSFKPYKGGDNAIWALNKICNGSKHRLIVPIGTGFTNLSLGPMALIAGPNDSGARMLTPRWDGEKDEMVMFIVGPESKVDYNFTLSFCIAFGDVEAVKGVEVFSTLKTMSARVERVVLAIEAETKRIRLVS